MSKFTRNKTKKRGVRSRKRVPQIYICCEGDNKSEIQYFRSFKGHLKIRYVPCNETDPVSLAEHLISECDKKDFDAKQGDLGFCVVDADVSSAKNLVKLQKKLTKSHYVLRISQILIFIRSFACCKIRFTN